MLRDQISLPVVAQRRQQRLDDFEPHYRLVGGHWLGVQVVEVAQAVLLEPIDNPPQSFNRFSHHTTFSAKLRSFISPDCPFTDPVLS